MSSAFNLVPLSAFGRYLAQPEKSLATSHVRALAFYCKDPETECPAVLSADSPEELAQVLALMLGLAYLDNKKAALKELETERLSAGAYAQKLQALEDAWLVQSLNRDKKTNEPKISLESKLPEVLLNVTKLGQLLARNEATHLLQGIDFADPKGLQSLENALASRATHVVKLSVDSGASRDDVKGGFFKGHAVATGPEFEGSICEQDYQAPGIGALTCNAADQSNSWLAFTSVHFDGQIQRLPQLLAMRPDVHEPVLAHLIQGLAKFGQSNPAGLAKVFEALAAPRESTFSGEPQLFCQGESGASVVAPLMPLSLLQELLRAKESLREAYRKPLLEAAAIAAEEEAQKLQVLTELKAQDADSFPGGKAAFKLSVKDANEAHTQAKAAAKVAEERAKKGFLAVPNFTLMLGGSTPRNVASGLTTAIHSASILTLVREPKSRAEVGNKVFYSASLLAVPRILETKVPAVFTSKKLGAQSKRERRSLFANWALQALEPLLDLREVWRQEQADTDPELESSAREVLAERNDAKAVFAKGSAHVAGKAAEALFEDLVREVCGLVKEGLRNAFPKEAFGEFDAELYEEAMRVVLAERA